jgi:hypothetical protein
MVNILAMDKVLSVQAHHYQSVKNEPSRSVCTPGVVVLINLLFKLIGIINIQIIQLKVIFLRIYNYPQNEVNPGY